MNFDGWHYYKDAQGNNIGLQSPSGGESWLLTAPEVVEWIAQGNTPLPAPAPPPPDQQTLDVQAAKAYAPLAQLAAMTPSQVQTFVQNNVTNLAQVQNAIQTLAIAVAILARRL